LAPDPLLRLVLKDVLEGGQFGVDQGGLPVETQRAVFTRKAERG
jgi:hypothetical protein